MRHVETLSSRTLPLFLDYCRRHNKTHDESFLSEGELNRFRIDENISLVLIDSEKKDSLYGVFSLMLKRKGRVRIFHCETGSSDDYMLLHKAMLKELKLSNEAPAYSLFITEPGNEAAIEIFQGMGLNPLRYIYVLEREISAAGDFVLPDGYSLRAMKFPDDAGDWARIRNESMNRLLGYKYYGRDFFLDMNQEEEYLEDCTLILRHKEKAIGIIKAERDEQEDRTFGFIGPIAILPEYQGQGLGRCILRYMIHILTEQYGWPASLCVNAENEDALSLYLQEGFKKTEIVRELGFYSEI